VKLLLRSLQFKISASLFLVGALLITISTLRLNERSIQSRREAMHNMAFAEGSRLSGMAQHLLRRQISRAADLELSYASTRPDLKLGLIMNGEDVVVHATWQQLRGLTLADTSLASSKPLVEEVRRSMEGKVIEQGTTLLALFPFWEGREQGRGCVLLAYDLERSLSPALVFRGSIAQALTLIGGSLVLWLLLKWTVTRRVGTLVEQVQRLTPEEPPLAPMAGQDELAQVSLAVHTAHERLRRSEQRLRQVAAAMRDVFWLAPAEASTPPYVNEAYWKVFGRDERNLLKRRWDWLRVVSREDRRRCLDMLRHLRQEGAEYEMEVRANLPDGGQHWLHCRGFSAPGGCGQRHDAVGIVMDVSDRKNLERRLLDAAEKERRHIGVELHDDLCQRLAAVLMKTGVLQSALAGSGSGQQALAEELIGDLSDATGVARSFARGLAPVGIEALGLPVALSDLGEFIHRGFKVPCRVECSAVEASLVGETSTHVFRVAQELATNAAKHARPGWIDIAHNGIAYRPDQTSKEGMGMHLVRQRLNALGASLTWRVSEADHSVTVVECQIPLNATLEFQPAIPS
jgi:PAS domain S-box-containing protein